MTPREITSHYIPFFDVFLRHHCLAEGSTPIEDFYDDFAMFCIEEGVPPAGKLVVGRLIDQQEAGLISDENGKLVVGLKSIFKPSWSDWKEYVEDYGDDVYGLRRNDWLVTAPLQEPTAFDDVDVVLDHDLRYLQTSLCP